MGLFGKKTNLNTATVPAIVALITHPSTPRNERSAALSAYERKTGTKFNIINARRQVADHDTNQVAQKATNAKWRRGLSRDPEKRQASQPYENYGGCAPASTCAASRSCEFTGGENSYSSSNGGSYQAGPAWSTVDGLHADYDAAC